MSQEPRPSQRRSGALAAVTLLLAILGVPVRLVYGWCALFLAILSAPPDPPGASAPWYPEYLAAVAGTVSDSLVGFGFALLGFPAWTALRRGRHGSALLALACTALSHTVLWVSLLIFVVVAGFSSHRGAWLFFAGPAAISGLYASWVLATWRHRRHVEVS